MASLQVSVAVMTVVVLFFATTTSLTEAQASCAQKLIPCQADLNTTTTPAANCCSAIRDAVTNELTCLCNLYNDPTLLKTLGINVTQATGIAQRCNINSDLSSCVKAASPTAPPGVPGNDGSRMVAWTGFSSLVLLLAASLFY